MQAQGDAIDWYTGGIDAAFAHAQSQGKPLFLYWGAEWCPPCHYLKTKIFTRPEFLARMKEFVPVYLDGDEESAQTLGEKLGVKGYPTVIIFSAAGEEMTRMPSTLPVEQYAEVLDRAVSMTRPLKQILAAVLAGGPADAPATDLNLLAFYSWDQDDKVGLTDEEEFDTFQLLYEQTPDVLPVEKSRFLTFYLGQLIAR
jgi:thioredoxin-like negative regulator of GroEL